LDTLTHVVLGACLGEVLATKKIGKKALVLGAIAQTIPDFDLVCSLWMEPSANVLAHRGFTHSFLFALLLAPLLAYAFHRWWPKRDTTFKFWFTFFSLQILLHIVLDAFNAYGTAWFEPFTHDRFSFHTLFVADPLFSIPLGIACIVLVLKSVDYNKRIHWAMGALIISTLYLGFGIMSKLKVDEAVKTSLSNQHIPFDKYFTSPTPFNTLLWFAVASNNAGSYVGYRSVFDTHAHINYQFFPRQDSLLNLATDQAEVMRLKRFSQGYYTVELHGDTLIFNDLRFGQMIGWQKPRAGFVFHYYLQPELDNRLVLQRGRFANWDKSATRALVNRALGLE
jgi:inner membrane protein